MAQARVEIVQQAYCSHSPDGNTKTQADLVVAHNSVSSGRVGYFSRNSQTPGILLTLPTEPQGFLVVPKVLPGPLSR